MVLEPRIYLWGGGRVGWQKQSLDSNVLHCLVRCSCSYLGSGFRSSNDALPLIPHTIKVTDIGNKKLSDSCGRHQIIETWLIYMLLKNSRLQPDIGFTSCIIILHIMRDPETKRLIVSFESRRFILDAVYE